jgi:acetoin utilization deacetylase AcuC-like enzyme
MPNTWLYSSGTCWRSSACIVPSWCFYLAGADPYRFDQLGGLGLTLEGLRRRDELVFEVAAQAGARVAVCLAGGYAMRPDDTVEINCNTVRAASPRRPADARI